jgi:hypothetical protein
MKRAANMPWHQLRLTGASGEPTVRQVQGKITRAENFYQSGARDNAAHELTSLKRIVCQGVKRHPGVRIKDGGIQESDAEIFRFFLTAAHSQTRKVQSAKRISQRSEIGDQRSASKQRSKRHRKNGRCSDAGT